MNELEKFITMECFNARMDTNWKFLKDHTNPTNTSPLREQYRWKTINDKRWTPPRFHRTSVAEFSLLQNGISETSFPRHHMPSTASSRDLIK